MTANYELDEHEDKLIDLSVTIGELIKEVDEPRDEYDNTDVDLAIEKTQLEIIEDVINKILLSYGISEKVKE